jgi:hypothetical protein
MSRTAFNITCSVIFIAVMLTLRHFLELASDQFLGGLGVGIFSTLMVLWICAKGGFKLY